jgi:RHS repeat-associated protein
VCFAESLNAAADNQNRIHKRTGADFRYDAAGNMTFDPVTGNSYALDPENRITSAGGFNYAYDSNGNRVIKSNGITGTIYWYTTLGIVAESDLSGNLTSEYVFFDGDRVARKDFPSNNVSHYFSDHLRTASVITDAAGNITEDEDFYPWGGEVQFVNGDPNHYKFTGKERDAETQIDYFGAWYYGIWLGRFITPDPLYLELHRLVDPQQLNIYAYIRNNPLKFTDPTGLDVTCTGNRCDDYLKGLQKDVSFKVAYDDNGTVVAKGDIDNKNLSKSDKELLKAIDDRKHHVTINAIDGGKDSSVFLGASSHTIAFDQAALLDQAKNAGGLSSAQLVGHETLEGYYESKGESLPNAHDDANRFFGGLTPGPVTSLTVLGGKSVIGVHQQFTVFGSGAKEDVSIRFVTPIPLQSVVNHTATPQPSYPVDMEKKP